MRKSRSCPASFSHPGGRGFAARPWIRSTIRTRSRLGLMASSSFTADALIDSLYAATLPEVPDHGFERGVGFVHPFLDCGEVLRVFGERNSDGIVDHVRDRAIGRGSLQAQGVVQRRVEIDGRALRLIHTGILTL